MLDIVKQIIKENNCKIRFSWFYNPDYETTKWVEYFNFPEEGYIEIPLTGPIKTTQLKWLEINPIEIKKIGRLIPEKEINHTKEIIDILNEENIIFSFNQSFIKINNEDFNMTSIPSSPKSDALR